MNDQERKERQYWLWVTKPEYYLDEDGNDREDLDPAYTESSDGWWTCHKDTRKGDLVLLYRSKIKKDIGYLIQAGSDAYPIRDDEFADEQGWKYACDYRVLYKFSSPIGIQLLKKEAPLSDWIPLRLSFQRSVFRIEPNVWEKLNRLITQYQPDYEQFLLIIDQSYTVGLKDIENMVKADLESLQEEEGIQIGFEGGQKSYFTNRYERDPKLANRGYPVS